MIVVKIIAILFFSISVKSTSSKSGIVVMSAFVISIFKKDISSSTGGGIVVVVVVLVVVAVGVAVVVVGVCNFAARVSVVKYSSLTKLKHSTASQSSSDSFTAFVI